MTVNLDPQLLAQLQSRTPLLWLNPARGGPLPDDAPSLDRIDDAQQRLARCAPLLAELFRELANAAGQIESRLMPAQALQQQLGGASASGSWYLKRDDELPVAGSIKARGGFHEVLALAESIALEHGLLPHADADRRLLATPQARALFGQYAVTVGSTGNLGMSIGVMAAALGFDAVVHMSADAKEWKKDRLRQRGVRVIEHAGDYAQAVAAGRAQALAAPRSHFVDDEQSELLFFGYAAAARGLARQLVCTTAGDLALAERCADEVAQWIWTRRENFRPSFPSPAEGVAQALAAAHGPVVVNEYADNPGGGTPGDGTHLLRAVLDARPAPGTCCFASINDAAVVEQARQAGVGATISVSLGGKQGRFQGESLRVNAYVKAITDGRFINRAGSMFEGVRFDLGAMCRLLIQGVDVIVASRAEQIYDEEPFFLHGIDVTAYKLIAIKGANHFRAGYRRLAAQIISVDSVGLSTADITSFPRERLVGEYWPLSDRAALEDRQGA